ncbi:glycosyltransferase [Bacteroidales bacterium]|nr:glycosyltransferase [Bacteroidales bacterium]
MSAGFADKYLQKQNYSIPIIERPVRENLSIVVVIPCYNEPDICHTISSLLKCNVVSDINIEIIIVVNDGVSSPENIIAQNNQTYRYLLQDHFPLSDYISIVPVRISNVVDKKQGAGFARKVGMDLATTRFNQINKSDGVIVSLDADTLVAPNYFDAIYEYFKSDKKSIGATINFNHNLEGHLSKENYDAIVLYELHLRYYKQMLDHIGFPYSFFTIGSAFCVVAITYVKEGGMNDKKAGEDFYFLQKIIPNGKFGEINNTCVFPSPRFSDRVPFGTGPMLQQIKHDRQLKTYALQSFFELQFLFQIIPNLYHSDPDIFASQLPIAVLEFLETIEWRKIIFECRKNSGTKEAFVKRFYNNFNAFRVVKYLNYYHCNYGAKVNVGDAVKTLLKSLGVQFNDNIGNLELLHIFRNIEIEK